MQCSNIPSKSLHCHGKLMSLQYNWFLFSKRNVLKGKTADPNVISLNDHRGLFQPLGFYDSNILLIHLKILFSYLSMNLGLEELKNQKNHIYISGLQSSESPKRFTNSSEYEEEVPLINLNLSPFANSSLRTEQELIKDLLSVQDLSKNWIMIIIHSRLKIAFLSSI